MAAGEDQCEVVTRPVASLSGVQQQAVRGPQWSKLKLDSELTLRDHEHWKTKRHERVGRVKQRNEPSRPSCNIARHRLSQTLPSPLPPPPKLFNHTLPLL